MGDGRRDSGNCLRGLGAVGFEDTQVLKRRQVRRDITAWRLEPRLHRNAIAVVFDEEQKR